MTTSKRKAARPAHADARKAARPAHADAVDSDIKSDVGARLRRIEGQVRGVQKMVDEQRYCADILVQLASVQEALRGVSRELLRNHLKHCATTKLAKGGADANAMVDELVELMHKHNR